MPPSAPKAAKRKALAAPVSDDDYEDPSEHEVGETPEQMAKRAFLGEVAEVVPPVKHSSSSGVSACIEGVITRVGDIMVSQDGRKVGKTILTIQTERAVITGCNNALCVVEGAPFGLPTRRLAASPEAMAKDPKAKGPVVLDVSGPGVRANFLSQISCSFYKEEGGDKKGKKDAGMNLEACTPGMRVLVSGVCCEHGKAGKESALYTNAKRVLPLSDSIAVGDAAKKVIQSAKSGNSMAGSSFLLSAAMGGFFGLTYNEPCHQQQAEVFKAKWKQLVDGTAAKLENIATAVGKEKDTEATVAALTAHLEKVKAMTPEEVAAGASLFDVELPKDCRTPYTAAIVQSGIKPSPKHDFAAPQMCTSLFDPDKRDLLPECFCEAKVVDISTSGNLVQLSFRLFFVGKLSAAIAATREGKNPVLRSTNAAASVKFTKKTLGPELFGTLVVEKIDTMISETLWYADMALYASVFPRGPDDPQLDGHFAGTSGIDMMQAIPECGVQVSEGWLDDKMLGKRGVFIYPQPDSAVAVVEPTAAALPAPTLAKNGYQAITEGSFEFDSLRVPAGRARQYFVFYKGCATNVGNTPDIKTSTAAGEKHLEDIVPNVRDDNDFKVFLRQDCVVYAVAV